MDQKLFEAAKCRVMLKQHDAHGFGTLKEKTVHAVMKLYYAPDEDTHEIPVEGFIADIYDSGNIIEIQNGNFYKLRSKLDAYLPLYDVTVVLPLYLHKYNIWIDPDDGTLSKKNKCPSGSVYNAFPELYRIRPYLTDPHLHFIFPMLDIEEYRMLNGWSRDRKHGSERYDRIPVALEAEYRVNEIRDYMQFVPYELEDGFTSAEFAAAAHIHRELADVCLNILYHTGNVIRTGKHGSYWKYEVNYDSAPGTSDLFHNNHCGDSGI